MKTLNDKIAELPLSRQKKIQERTVKLIRKEQMKTFLQNTKNTIMEAIALYFAPARHLWFWVAAMMLVALMYS